MKTKKQQLKAYISSSLRGDTNGIKSRCKADKGRKERNASSTKKGQARGVQVQDRSRKAQDRSKRVRDTGKNRGQEDPRV